MIGAVQNSEARWLLLERGEQELDPRQGRRMTFAASAGDIIGLAGVAGTVVTLPGVRTTTRVTPFEVTTVVVVRPSELTCCGPAGGTLVLGAAAATPVTPATPGAVLPGV
jgi:hypothetical protein